MSIFDVQHQERAHRIIQRALASNRMPHAYLFAGPEGVGREMLATRLAAALLCSSPVRRPLPEGIAGPHEPGEGRDACGECQDCRLAAAGTHPDLFLIHRQLNRLHPDATIRKQKALFLGVDVIRHFVVERQAMRPNRGRAKVFIVREAQRLNDAAQNCLLKTLEEPPADTFIILLTSAMDRMLPTTRSRCQQVVFRSLPDGYVTDRLQALRPDASAEAIGYIARHAGGSLGLALRQTDDGLYALKRAWGGRLMELVTAAPGFWPHKLAGPFLTDAKELAKGVAERDPDVSDTDATRAGLQMLLAVLADFCLDALRQGVGMTSGTINADQPDVVDRLRAGYGPGPLGQALRHLSEAAANLGRNAHLELTLETLFIRLAAAARGQTTPSPRRAAG